MKISNNYLIFSTQNQQPLGNDYQIFNLPTSLPFTSLFIKQTECIPLDCFDKQNNDNI